METNNTKIINKTMEEVMHESMIPYSEYVILDRALPRVEDGLKPVQRRVLYSMYGLGLTPDKPYKKCARIVGECLGKFHPHGDTSVYQAMVRLAQPFNMGSILVDGHGNFGSIDGDGAAAMRYTEARMAPLAMELLRDLEKDTVRWSPNFDDSTIEPDFLPGRFPNLLVNGASGIAVGLATNIPPHNLCEAIDGVIAYIDNSRIKLKDLMKIIPGPDFPSGGKIIKGELEKAYETGKGKIQIRATVHVEGAKDEKQSIIIEELPYQVNKATLLESISKLRDEKKGILLNISEITDESDRNGMRAVIKVKKEGDAEQILNLLFKSTNLEVSYGINMVAIADGKPQQMGIMDIIAYYIDYQRTVIYRRTKYELDQAKERAHILEGLVIAVQNIDEVVAIIKSSRNTTEAKEKLRARFKLSEKQAQAIIDLRLGRLTSLEIYKLEKELEELHALIEKLTAILSSKRLQMDLIKAELLAIKKQYKTPRRSVVLDSVNDYKVEKDEQRLEEQYIVVVNAFGDIKKMSTKSFSMASKEFTDTSTRNEICSSIVKISKDQRACCFTNLGNCYKVDLEDIPDGKWKEKTVKLDTVIKGLLPNEKIVFIQPMGDETPKGDILFYTRDGMVKRSPWSEYGVLKSSYQAIKLKDGDEVIGMEHMKQGHTLAFITSNGMCLNADMSDIPSQGRISAGVKGIKLIEGDKCVFVGQVNSNGEFAVITDKGYAKRVATASIEPIGRYSKGVKIIDFKSVNGKYLQYGGYVTEDKKIVIELDGEYMMSFSTNNFNIESRTQVGRALVKGRVTITDMLVYNDNLTN